VKRKLLLIIRIAAFVLVAGIVLSRIYNVLKWKDTNGGFLSSVEQLYNTPDNTIEVAFFGSSHCFCGISPSYMWENYGIAAFDMSTSAQDKTATVFYLKELLKTQHPTVVFVDLYALTYDYHKIAGNAYRNLLSARYSLNSVKYVWEYMESDKPRLGNLPVSTLEMLAKWPVIHSRYKELSANDYGDYEPNTYVRGEAEQWAVNSFDWSCNPSEEMGISSLSDENQEWIDELISLSEDECFDLVFMMIPYDLWEGQQKDNNAASEYINARGYDAYDFNCYREEIGLDCHSDFCDKTHLNPNGAVKLSEYIVQNILSQYPIEDRRGQVGYEQWDKDILYSNHQQINYMLSGDVGPQEAALAVGNTKGYSKIVSFDGNIDKDICAQYGAFFESLGIEENQIPTDGGKWLITDDSICLINANDYLTAPFYYDLSKKDTLKIEFNGTLSPSNIMIGDTEIESPFCYVTFAVYDELLDELVYSQGY